MAQRHDIGIGLISVGWMGKLHTRGYTAIPYHYPEFAVRPHLVIAADPEEERMNYAREVLGYREATADYHDVLNHPHVDVVSITAPNFLHREIGLAAAAAGKPFWIEKPLGRNLAETSDVAAAVRGRGLVTSVGFNYRHVPLVNYARHLVQSGQLGEITHLRSVFFNDYAAEPNAALSWRFRRELGGSGALGDLMSHAVDLVQYVVGPIVAVTALATTVIRQRPELPMGSGNHFAVIENGTVGRVENEDYAASLVRLGGDGPGGGAVGTIEASRVTVGPRCDVGFEIYGTAGALRWSFERMNELEVALGKGGAHHGFTTIRAGLEHGDYAHFQPGPGISMGYDDLKVIEAKLFMESVLAGQQLAPSVEEALSTVRVLQAAEDSATSGAWESIKATF
ncbi:Gfo/Idh/MocA family oxidoreductase [Lysinibacter sp. HNR]|uniref:Gfo/Idh/MocA family protein n=1 Tax=Lysinibacter sp. HNR TaxID=3031408 RepID=UPI002434FCEA|nr:Gfo/Idh/MocA family oxidoreductase [Lysinibacter sp. HNR]WGD37174.1 Gfo/Idh/MocA family oxidoreductase [Lysinibacter sp. HNR]